MSNLARQWPGHVVNGELADIRRSIINFDAPVLIDAHEAAIALDISQRAVEERFENRVVEQGRGAFRHLMRTAEVRAVLLERRPKPVLPRARLCWCCGAPLPPRARRFCRECIALTPNGQLLRKQALQNPAESKGP